MGIQKYLTPTRAKSRGWVAVPWSRAGRFYKGDEVTQVIEAKGLWMPVKDYAALMSHGDARLEASLIRLYKDMLNPNSKRTRRVFAAAHVRRDSPQRVFLYVTKPSATSPGAPLTVQRQK